MTDVLALLFVVGIVFVLLRPQSPAVAAIDAFGDMLVAIARSAADIAAPAA